MLDESIVQFHGRIRVHATKRVESKRNEVIAVPVTDLPVRVDVVVVEPAEGQAWSQPFRQLCAVHKQQWLDHRWSRPECRMSRAHR